MYRSVDRLTLPLFPELFPFGGQLNRLNRWLKLAELIPWDEIERRYANYFSEIGRPATDARFFAGLFILKHMLTLSDEGVLESVRENPYQQALCGFTNFQTGALLNSSTLSKLRGRLGVSFFREFEATIYAILIELKVIKPIGMHVDATVFSEDIKYPNDVMLLNDVRTWLVNGIKAVGSVVGQRCRTYRRKAHIVYLGFAKKKRKTRKEIRWAKKQLLQYVRRNLKQFSEVAEQVEAVGHEISAKVMERFDVARTIYEQQLDMYRRKSHQIADRIVSFHRPYVRPIKRGKSGSKSTEFGAKGALVHVDGFLFLDHLEHRAFAEEHWLEAHVQGYRDRFNRLPPYVVGDQKYGTRDNRRYFAEQGIRSAFKPLGRKRSRAPTDERWRKKKQRERNRIEGDFGNGKRTYDLDRVRYSIDNGSEIWVRGGILAMNLKTALRRT